jgi:hypothetical protein
MDIEIKMIPHSEQRYATCGDYVEDNDVVRFRVSELGDWKFEYLIAIHELIEYTLARTKGITVAEIDAFDRQFEKDRDAGLHFADEEPGFDPEAPYFREHALATKIERMLAIEMGIDWDDYTKRVNAL